MIKKPQSSDSENPDHIDSAYKEYCEFMSESGVEIARILISMDLREVAESFIQGNKPMPKEEFHFALVSMDSDIRANFLRRMSMGIYMASAIEDWPIKREIVGRLRDMGALGDD